MQWHLGPHTQTPQKIPGLTRQYSKLGGHLVKATEFNKTLDPANILWTHSVLRTSRWSLFFLLLYLWHQRPETAGKTLLMQPWRTVHVLILWSLGMENLKHEGLTATCPPSTLRYCRTSLSADIAHWLWKQQAKGQCTEKICNAAFVNQLATSTAGFSFWQTIRNLSQHVWKNNMRQPWITMVYTKSVFFFSLKMKTFCTQPAQGRKKTVKILSLIENDQSS